MYRKFVDGLVMNYYNKLTKDNDLVMFGASYEMSGVRTAVNIMIFSLIISIVMLPIDVVVFFIWIFFICSFF